MLKNKIITGVLALSMLLSFVGCSKNAAETTPSSSSVDATSPTANISDTQVVDTTQSTVDLSGCSFETMYGNQISAFLGHTYMFEGVQIPEAEVNFYFVNAFLDLTQYATYGIYPATVDGYLDLAAEFDSDDEAEDLYATWGDFYVAYAEKMLESTAVINQLASEEGVVLSEESQDSIDASIEELNTTGAQAANMTLDDYLALYYGPACDEAAFRSIMERYYIADLYTTQYCDNYEFAEDEIMVPNVCYTLFAAPEASATEEDLATAEQQANDFLAGCEDIESFQLQGQALYDAGECMEYGSFPVELGTTVQAFEDWAFDEARVEGEMGVIYAPEYGYFAIGYIGLVEVDDSIKDQIAVNALGAYVISLVDDGTYEFTLPNDYEPAVEAVHVDNGIFTETSAVDASSQASGLVSPTPSISAPGQTPVSNGLVWALAGAGGLALLILFAALIVYLVRLGKNAKEPNEKNKSNEKNKKNETDDSENSEE